MKTFAFAMLFNAAFAVLGTLFQHERVEPKTDFTSTRIPGQSLQGEKRTRSVIRQYSTSPFQPGESLRYSVKWGFIRLGTVEVRQQVQEIRNRTVRVHLSAVSAAGLPFVDVRLREHSLLAVDDPRIGDFTIRQDHDPKAIKHYLYNPATGMFSVEIREDGKAVRREKRMEARRCYDAVGALMYLRGLAGSGASVTMHTLMNFSVELSQADFPAAREMVDTPAFDVEVPAYRIRMRSTWTDESAGGMGGNFDLWCSTDAAAIPLRAEIDIAVGSIVLELESCVRPGWSRLSLTENRARAESGREVGQ